MKTLVAGFGNIFLSDDGFGPAVIRALDPNGFPPDVRIRDFGIGGMHLALEMLEGYDLVVIVDAVSRDDAAGTVFAIEVDPSMPRGASIPQHDTGDPHAMDVSSVLSLYERVRAQSGVERTPHIIVAGCVPLTLEEGMELSMPVRAAIPVCAQLIQRLTFQTTATGVQP
jgi:hydrogenase maturation protease